MILVAGGTGRLGTSVVRELSNQRRQVRVLVLDRSRPAVVVGTTSTAAALDALLGPARR